ncbi:MAG TPA: hypothetical protein VNP73_10660, partial [Actinomycetota bacterium]|nr:hypothetical protein [Actinomycetota bacterium]
MNRPRLLQRRVDIWKDPWTKIEESDPPYSAFILSLTRASVGLLALAAGLMVIGNLQDNGRLIWGALALMVPAVLYLLLVYAWAWARAALDEVSYGNITLDESEPPPTVTAQKPSRNRIEAWWRARRRKKPTERRSDANMVWRLTKECRRYWIHIVGVLLISLAATPIFLLSPIPLKIAVDSVLKGLPLPEILSDHLPGFFSSSGFSLLVV